MSEKRLLGRSATLNPPGTEEWVERCREEADEDQARAWAKRFGYVLALGIAAEGLTIVPLAYLVMTMPVHPATALLLAACAIASLLCAEKIVKAAGNWCVASAVGVAFEGYGAAPAEGAAEEEGSEDEGR